MVIRTSRQIATSVGPVVSITDVIAVFQRHFMGVRVMLNLKVVTWSLGIFAAVSFVLCVIYGLVVPNSLHSVQALEAVLPAFRWLTLGGFILGLLESFLYGVYVGLVFVPIYNVLSRRWSSGHTPGTR